MTVSPEDRNVVDRLFKAMQAGMAGEQDLMELFADDAVFVEPFSGQSNTHVGKSEIRESFRCMFENPAPDTELTVDRVDLDGQQVRAEWTCTSPIFPAPMKGYDLFTIQQGKIARLEVHLVSSDQPG